MKSMLERVARVLDLSRFLGFTILQAWLFRKIASQKMLKTNQKNRDVTRFLKNMSADLGEVY